MPVTSAPAAECVTVIDGKITDNRFIFDRAPFLIRQEDRGRQVTAPAGEQVLVMNTLSGSGR